ncbi:retention module-containing protein, partial [Comamonas sp. CMM02]|uniref:retention module-containing protein n=1 Tax=Comamonas sp. CMM02 TaxID=2769307 RepID=UPI001782C282
MANTSALITKLEGQAWVRNSDGSLQPLRVGMRIPIDADIVTAAGSQLSLQGNEDGVLQIAADQQLKLSEDLFQAAEPSEAAIANPVDADVNALITALNDGQDPLAELDPTAATLSGGEGAGSTYVRLASVIERTTPLALQYPRSISAGTENFISGGVVAQDDEPAPPAQASIGSDAQTVYEAGLGNEATSETSSGTFSVSASDGIASITIGGVSYSLAQLKGNVALLPPVNTPDGTIKITGFVSDAGNQNGTVSYEYTLTAAQAHASGDGNNTLTDTIAVGVVGSGGVTSTGEIVITIVDDVPVVTLSGAASVVEGAAAITGAWNLAAGADGVTPANFTISIDGGAAQTVAYGTGINTGKGTLTINANNTWSFVPASGLNNAGGVNVNFTLSAKDGDNDTSSATHTISVTDGPGPVVSGPNGGVITLALDDQNLAGGSTPANPDFAQDAITFTAGSDAIASLK